MGKQHNSKKAKPEHIKPREIKAADDEVLYSNDPDYLEFDPDIDEDEPIRVKVTPAPSKKPEPSKPEPAKKESSKQEPAKKEPSKEETKEEKAPEKKKAPKVVDPDDFDDDDDDFDGDDDDFDGDEEPIVKKEKKPVKKDDEDNELEKIFDLAAIQKFLDGISVKSIVAKLKSIFDLPLIIAFIFDIIYGAMYYSSFNCISLYDTASYDQAGDRLLQGHLDLLRTPGYPLFLKFVARISNPEKFREVGCGIQIFFFYIGIIVFYLLLKKFIKNPVVLAAGTIFYGCLSPIITFNTMLLTESFSATGIVIFAYLLVDYVQTGNRRRLNGAIILSLVLTMIRPSALNLFIVLAICMIPYFIELIKKVLNKKSIQKISSSLIVYVVCIGILFGYMCMNKAQNNYFGLSYVSEMNKFYDIVLAECWMDNSDTEMVESIRRMQDEGYGVLGSAIETEKFFRENGADPQRLIDFNDEALRRHGAQHRNYIIKKTIYMGESNQLNNLSHDSNFLKEEASRDTIWLGDFLDCNINFVYFMFLLSAVIIATVWFKNKTLLWKYIVVTLIIGGQLAVNVLAGPGEFGRLTVPCYPFALLLIIVWVGITTDVLLKKESKKA